jgi:head-tail adaptor
MTTAVGQLRERVRFQQRTLDANGDRLGPWDADGILVAAEVVALRGSEPVIQQRLLGVQPLQVTVRCTRATEQVDSGWRMLWRGQAYNIKAPPAADPRRMWISILAEADQTQGG